MVSKVLLDTDILSELLRGRSPAVRDRVASYLKQHDALTICSLTVAEIVKGLEKRAAPAQAKRFRDALPSMEVIGFGLGAAMLAGKIFAALDQVGQPIGRIDPLIAATAIHERLALATGNVAHYRRIQELGFDLSIEDWKTQG